MFQCKIKFSATSTFVTVVFFFSIFTPYSLTRVYRSLPTLPTGYLLNEGQALFDQTTVLKPFQCAAKCNRFRTQCFGFSFGNSTCQLLGKILSPCTTLSHSPGMTYYQAPTHGLYHHLHESYFNEKQIGLSKRSSAPASEIWLNDCNTDQCLSAGMTGFWSNDLDYVLCRTPDTVESFLDPSGGVVLDLSPTNPPSECPSNHVITAIADLNNYYYIRLDEAKCLPLAVKWKIDYSRCIMKMVVAARAPLSNMTNWSNQCPVDDNIYFITQLVYYTGKNYLKEYKCCPAVKFMFN